jgi:hypothetical protein
VPNASASQKTFKTGFIFITRAGMFTGTEPAAIETIRSAWAGRFASLTGGKGSIGDVTPSISIAVSSPAAGETISRPYVTVKGTVISTDNETGVTVNGVSALVTGSQFLADHVALTEGANSITITATDTAGNTATTSLDVNSIVPAKYITVSSNIQSGISPLEVVLKIDSTFEFDSSMISVAGPGSVEWISSDFDTYRVKMTIDGSYACTVSVTDTNGTEYQDTVTVTVLNRNQLDKLLKAKWEGMKTKLASQDINGAIHYFSDTAKTKYQTVFQKLSNRLPTIVSSMENITLNYIGQDVAEYRISRTETINGQSMEITYFIYFVQDESGLWKIESF